jgi:hypothetical protein
MMSSSVIRRVVQMKRGVRNFSEIFETKNTIGATRKKFYSNPAAGK